MATAVETHACSSTVGALAGMLTSLTMCLESGVWSCKNNVKSAGFSALSIAFFVAVNVAQPKLGVKWTGALNNVAAVMPSILFVVDEYQFCKKHGTGGVGKKTLQLVEILPMILLPILISTISGNTHVHDLVCESLHAVHDGMASKSAKTSSQGYIEQVKLNAQNALHAAQTSLLNAYENPTPSVSVSRY